MELKDFNELCKRDFENGAVRNAIRGVFKERDEARAVSVRLIHLNKAVVKKCDEIWNNPDLPADIKLHFKVIKWDIETVLHSKIEGEKIT